jgi:hypothetical protein
VNEVRFGPRIRGDLATTTWLNDKLRIANL